VYYKCVKLHKNPISHLGGVALTRYMDGQGILTHICYNFFLYIDQHPGNNCVLFIKLFTISSKNVYIRPWFL
jgi:hypothetical protein